MVAEQMRAKNSPRQVFPAAELSELSNISMATLQRHYSRTRMPPSPLNAISPPQIEEIKVGNN